MVAPLVRIDARRIVDRESFHDVFAEAFGFFDGYGRNMHAWIDCLSDLGLTQITAAPGEVVTLQIDNVDDFAQRCPDLYEDLIDCAAFVNWRDVDRGLSPALAISFYKKARRR
jgi:RNAse (barnase) inhibitor barstar